jgi:hypothetical protein
MDINKELCKLLGIKSSEHKLSMNMVCIDGLWYPNFTSSDGKIELLRLMDDGKGRMPRFLKWIVDKDDSFAPSWLVIADYMMDKNGLLAQAARDYLRREKV